MTSIRKFAYAALLAVTALNLTPTLASAQEPVHGKFTLTHEVRWENAKVPAGDYEFSFDTNGMSPVLSLSKLSGAPTGFMLLVPSTEEIKYGRESRLVLESAPGGSYVRAMQLPEFGMTLLFTAPSHAAEKQIAKATTPATVSGQ